MVLEIKIWVLGVLTTPEVSGTHARYTHTNAPIQAAYCRNYPIPLLLIDPHRVLSCLCSLYICIFLFPQGNPNSHQHQHIYIFAQSVSTSKMLQNFRITPWETNLLNSAQDLFTILHPSLHCKQNWGPITKYCAHKLPGFHPSLPLCLPSSPLVCCVWVWSYLVILLLKEPTVKVHLCF